MEVVFQARQLGVEWCSKVHALDGLCFEKPYSFHQIHEEFLSKHASVFGIVQDQALIAALLVRAAENELWIFRIMVHPDWRGKGMAKGILKSVLLDTRFQNMSVWLEVAQSNHAAIGLYKSLGFVFVGVRKGYYATVHGKEDAFLMCLERNTHA